MKTSNHHPIENPATRFNHKSGASNVPDPEKSTSLSGDREPSPVENLALASWIWLCPISPCQPQAPAFDIWQPLRQWLNRIEVNNPRLARSLCQYIPAQCPFERDVKLFDRTLLHIPPLCKLNPVYDEVVALRFRALCYLGDVCGEDITPYC